MNCDTVIDDIKSSCSLILLYIPYRENLVHSNRLCILLARKQTQELNSKHCKKGRSAITYENFCARSKACKILKRMNQDYKRYLFPVGEDDVDAPLLGSTSTRPGTLVGPNYPGFGPRVTDPYRDSDTTTSPFNTSGTERKDPFGPPGLNTEPNHDHFVPPGGFGKDPFT